MPAAAAGMAPVLLVFAVVAFAASVFPPLVHRASFMATVVPVACVFLVSIHHGLPWSGAGSVEAPTGPSGLWPRSSRGAEIDRGFHDLVRWFGHSTS